MTALDLLHLVAALGPRVMARPLSAQPPSSQLLLGLAPLLLCLCWGGASARAAHGASTVVEFRGAWVHYQDYLSHGAISRTVAKAKRTGMNVLLPLANHPDNLMFKSTLQPMNRKVARGFDPLAELVKTAHAQGLEVHPYFLMLNGKLNGVSRKLPGARMIDRAGKTYSDWLCPTHDEVRAHLVQLVGDVLYTGIDGVHLDYIRYPEDARFCYCARCRAGFKKALGQDPLQYAPQNRPSYEQLEEWQARAGFTDWNGWRRQQVNRLVKEVSETVRARRPGVKLSAAAGTRDVDRYHVFRDGASWLRSGLVDFLCPMLYVVAENDFRMRAATELVMLRPHEFGKLFAGVAAYKLKGSPQLLVKQLVAAREFGFGGLCFFPFEYLDEAAVKALREGPFRQDAVLPWRAGTLGPVEEASSALTDHYRMGLVRKQLGDLPEAVLSFHAALTLDPANPDALHALAWTLAQQGRSEEASRCFGQFLEAEPHGPRADEARAAALRLKKMPTARLTPAPARGG